MRQAVEVIVDVPAMQTDQPFTYLVPVALTDAIAVGMRVEVPFGNGNRHVQGFVVAKKKIETEAPDAQETIQLKEIIRVLDLHAVLNTELLALADYMKDTTYAFKITCLQTMLPSVMKAEYRKFIVLLDEHASYQELFPDGQVEIAWEAAEEKGLLAQFMKLRQKGIVDIRYELKTKNKVKTQAYIHSLVSTQQAAELSKQIVKSAHKQRQLLQELSIANGPQLLAVFKEKGYSSTQLKQAAERGWLKIENVESYRDPYAHRSFEKTYPLELNKQQQAAVEKISTAVEQGSTTTYLLEGVTGSGKTEVYLQTIAKVLAANKTAIMLVPEIALTPQMVERFKGRFGEAVAVLHSALSPGEKYDEWRKIERQEAQVVVGARSAVFAPLENIGLIIIDEEHETTYKQDEAPRYHARDLALWRSSYHSCPVVLGSATPSLESRARAQKEVYQLLQLTERAKAAATLPKVDIVDMKEEYRQQQVGSFSVLLREKIQDRLAKHEQMVLLLNRRGYSSFVMCRDCGYVVPCPNCDISLTLHMDSKTMRCHYCGHEEAIPRRCPDCGSDKIRYYGTGTQKVEEELQDVFPEAAILRMDVDTTRKKGAHERLLQQFGEHKADILLGTQMIAKGLDFPNVTLVGVLNADTALNLPDFRSSERTFQLLTQVSGRAGRGDKAGEVVIQTFNPEHYALQLAKRQDYEGFYRHEMLLRHQSGYPPYYFTVKITASHAEETQAAKKIFQIAQELKQVLSPQSVVLGPTPSAIARVKQRYYYQMIIKYKHEPLLPQFLRQILLDTQEAQRRGLQLSIDNEPMYFI